MPAVSTLFFFFRRMLSAPYLPEYWSIGVMDGSGFRFQIPVQFQIKDPATFPH